MIGYVETYEETIRALRARCQRPPICTGKLKSLCKFACAATTMSNRRVVGRPAECGTEAQPAALSKLINGNGVS